MTLKRGLVLFCLFFHAVVCAQGWKIGPAPSWIQVIDPDPLLGKPGAEGGIRVRLMDQQYKDGVGFHAKFTRSVYAIESIEGTRAFEGVSIDYDPTWQKVVFHWARVLRGHDLQNRLDPKKIQVLQRETNLENGQLDGRRTLHFVLDDLRPGDELDLAWTLEGVHPAFPNISAGIIPQKFPWAVDRLHQSILWDRPGSPLIMPRNGAHPPLEKRVSGKPFFEWYLFEVPAYKMEQNLPKDWEDYPLIDVSNIITWEDLADLQRAAYSDGPKATPEVTTLAQKLSQGAVDEETRLLRTLRFLQDSIRYLGYEGGLGSHVPQSERVTLSTRQADCKGKSRLMVSLLRQEGIEAYPTLVNSNGGADLIDHPPSPWVFDHVVVCARIAKGVYLLDPTQSEQHGTLDHITPSSAKAALILQPNSGGLLRLKGWRPDKPEFISVENWDASQGPGHPATLERTVWRRGRLAQTFLQRISQKSSKSEAEAELEALKSKYPSITPESKPIWEEDSVTGTITWVSKFRCDSFWRPLEKSNTWNFYVSTDQVRDLALLPDGFAMRENPLAILDPWNVQMRIKVILPKRDWGQSELNWHSNSKEVDFWFRQTLQPNYFDLNWSWNSLADQVPKKHFQNWKNTLDSVRLTSEWTLKLDDRLWIMKLNGIFCLACLALLGGAIWGARKLEKWSPPSPSGDLTQRHFLWYVYGLLMLWGPLQNLQILWEIHHVFWADTSLTGWVFGVSAIHAWTVFFVVVIGPFQVLMNWLFWKKRSSFPGVHAVVAAGATLFNGAYLVSLATALPSGDKGFKTGYVLGMLLVLFLVWIPVVYFLISKRSRSFFRFDNKGMETCIDDEMAFEETLAGERQDPFSVDPPEKD